MVSIRKLVFATNNLHKFNEIQKKIGAEILLLSLSDIGFSEEIPEIKNTIEENASDKAYYIYNRFNINCFADDTGLEIEALSNEPGVYSARYAGKNASFDDNMNKVLEKMSGISNRNAVFRTVISLVENGIEKQFEGRIKGKIAIEKKGNEGFGYDPIFIPEGYQSTFSEMSLTEKNKISHRAIAVNKLIQYLKKK